MTRITTAFIVATLAPSVSPAALAAPSSCDQTAAIFSGCVADQGDITPTELACLRSALGKAQHDMTATYQVRMKITIASARGQLASVQRLWAQSTDANWRYFGGNAGSAARYECMIGAMIERKQTLQALD